MQLFSLLLSLVLTFNNPQGLSFDYNILINDDDNYYLIYYYSMPYQSLTFLKQKELFISRYQLTLQIFNKKDLIAGKILTKEAFAENYEITKNTNKYILDSVQLNLSSLSLKDRKMPLSVTVKIEDLQSDFVNDTQFKCYLPQATSQLVFLKNGQSNPSASYVKKLNAADTIQLYFYLYAQNVKYCSLYITYNKEQLKTHLLGKQTDKLSKEVLKTAIVLEESMVTSKAPQVYFQYPLDNLPSVPTGYYTVNVIGYGPDEKIFNIQKRLKITSSFFDSEDEYQEAVSRLIYIATINEMQMLRQIEPSKRESTWQAFWHKYDPNPITEFNEAEDEYFKKIDYCIEHFSKSDKGYKSDRARIYMKYGAPDYIEQRPFERDRYEYETWYYYSLGKKFIFRDLHGFGELRLYQESNL